MQRRIVHHPQADLYRLAPAIHLGAHSPVGREGLRERGGKTYWRGRKSFLVITTICLCLHVHGQSFLDPAFAAGGVYLQQLGTPGPEAFIDLAVQDDGKPIAVANGRIIRLTESGTLDQTFADQGIFTTDASFHSVTICQDGKIVGAGSWWDLTGGRPCLVRITADGELDETFGNMGVATFPMLTEGGFSAVQVFPDGSLAALCHFTLAAVSAQGLVRLTEGGGLDSTFDDDGILLLDFPTHAATALVLQDDDKILLGGNSQNGCYISRFGPGASLDPNFNGMGTVTLPGEMNITNLVMHPEGGILASGITTEDWVNEVWATRLTPVGAVDQAFGDNGTILLGIAPAIHASSAHLALAPDGGLLLGGSFLLTTGLGISRPFFLGLNSAGQPDSSFGVDGLILDSVNYNGGWGRVAMASSGRFYSWGGTSSSSGSQAAIYAYRGTQVGIIELPRSPITLSAFPNPARSNLHIILPDIMRRDYLLLDLQGRFVESGQLPSSGIMGIDHLAPGRYGLVFPDGGVSLSFIAQP